MAGGIALFGGSFNPIHLGHLIAGRAVLEQLGLDRLVFIPSPNPPHKQGHELTDARDRLEMARLAIDGEPHLEVSDIEIGRGGLSYTILTVESYRREVGSKTPLYWLIGGDSLPELHTWYQIDRLVETCTIVTAVRPGYETPELENLRSRLSEAQIRNLEDHVLATPRIDISATAIRERVRARRSIRYLVPESVRAYIEKNDLFR